MKRTEEVDKYAKSGVDYKKIEPFKEAMIETGKKTVEFARRRGVTIRTDIMHSHGAVFEIAGVPNIIFCQTQEGLGNKNYIAEWMYANSGMGDTFYRPIGIDVALMAVNDNIAQGAMPISYTDEVAAGDSDWFMDKKRANDLKQGFIDVCNMCSMALPAGESPSLRFLVNAEPPVKSAPTLSGCVVGIINPKSRLITGEKLSVGDHIIGAVSSGLHANGVSLVINEAMELPDKFMHKLPNGNTLGEEALIPTRSYVNLIESLIENEVNISALLPGTGSGVSKIAFDKRPYTYRIRTWVKDIPQIFLLMRELGVGLKSCLATFNWGVGYYIFVPANEVERTIKIGTEAGYELLDVGIVERGERKVIFEPENIILPPPGE